MSLNIKEYPFGYLFSDKPIDKVPSYYHKKTISDEFYYYFDPNVSHDISTLNNDFLIIHGDFIHIGLLNDISNGELADTLLSLFKNDYNEFLSILDYIAGRFTIIVNFEEKIFIFPDATNSRSNYYSPNKVLISSHAHLLAEVLDLRLNFSEKITSEVLLNTPYEEIKSTFPNHFVELRKNEVVRFFPRKNNEFKLLSESKKLQLVEKFWKKQLDHYFSHNESVILSLTGGLDSRFSLSLSKEYLNQLGFFTYTLKDEIDNSTDVSTRLSKDYSIVKQILRDIKLNHKFFFLEETTTTLTESESKNIQKNSIHSHNRLLVKLVGNEFGNNSLHLRANLLEIGQAYIQRKGKQQSNPENTKKAFLRLYGKQKETRDKLEIIYDKFVSKVDYFSNTYDYHLLDLVHWEMRVGRWICEVINNHDPTFRTITPFNHRGLICISLSFDYEKRRDAYMFKEIINRNYPLLNFYGINNHSNLYEQLRDDTDMSKNTLNQKSTPTQVSEKSKSNFYFKTMSIYNNKKLTRIPSVGDNIVYLPSNLTNKGDYSEVELPFDIDNGIVYLELQNAYSSKDIKNAVLYQIFKNDKLLITEDISNWRLPNYVSIPGLSKGDHIKIRLVVNKQLDSMSGWEVKSELKIKDYKQISSKMSDKQKINFSSPYSRVEP